MSHAAPSPDPLPAGSLRLAPGVEIPWGVLSFEFVASRGPGGQNVNKRATKCHLRIRLDDLPLRPDQRERLERLASSSINASGELVITADEHKSQPRNKYESVERLADLVRRALVRPKVRRATKPTRGSKERRLREKKARGDIKRARRDGE